MPAVRRVGFPAEFVGIVRADKSARPTWMQAGFSELIVDEMNRRGQGGDAWKAPAQREFSGACGRGAAACPFHPRTVME